MAQHHAPAMETAFGGGKYGKKFVEFMHAVKYDLPLPRWDENPPAPASQPENQTESPPENQSESGLIKPNQA